MNGWKTISDVEADVIPVENATSKEVQQSQEALSKLHGKAEALGTVSAEPCYFKPSGLLQQATICSLKAAEDYLVSLTERTTLAENCSLPLNAETIDEGHFYWCDSRAMLYWTEPDTSDDTLIKVANFKCEISNLVKEIERDGSSKKFAEMRIYYRKEIFSAKVSVGKDLKSELRTYPKLHVYDTVKFNEYIADLYGDFDEDKLTCHYNFYGWYRLPNSQHVYLNDAMENVSAKVKLSYDIWGARQFLDDFLKVSTEESKVLIMLNYASWSYLAYFYELLSIDGLRSVLYLSAPTGTGKTSLAKILSGAILKADEEAVLRFDDTLASLEEALFNRRDNLALVDDFYAKGNKFDDQVFKTKASAITRIVGDGRIKGKMGADRKPLPDRKYRGGVIATGEYIDLNTHSSYLRCWGLEFKSGSINFGAELSELQRYPNLARNFFSLWIQWLEKYQENILRTLRCKHEQYLAVCQRKFTEPYPRFSSNVATFLTVNYFLGEFCEKYNLAYDAQKAHYMILSEAEKQLQMLKQYSPIEIVINAINDALDNDELQIAKDETCFCSNKCDGFFEAKNMVVITQKLEAVIEKYAVKLNYGLKFNAALKNEMNEKSILEKMVRNLVLSIAGRGLFPQNVLACIN